MPPSPAAIVQPGTTIGPYVVESRIGRGGMGSVWLARHAQTRAPYALKIVATNLLVGDARRAFARFQREAEALAKIDEHPGIVRVFGSGVHHGTPWYAMERVEGISLAERLDRGPLDAAAAARLVASIANAIAYAHERGIVHRDLKPENVLIDAAGRARVVDFGLVLEEGAQRLTQTGAMVGTPLYMAPEQLRSASGSGSASHPEADLAAMAAEQPRVGPLADVYALGGILFAALVGRAPFADRQGLEVLRAVLTDVAPSPRSLVSSVPRPLETICLHALEKDPSLRYESAAAMEADLERFLRGEPIAASGVSGLGRLGRRMLPRSPARIAALGVLLLALAVAIAVVATPLLGRAPPPEARIAGLTTAFTDRGALDDAQRATLHALADDPAVADDPVLARRAEAFALLDRLVSDETDADEASARLLAALARPDGAIDHALLDAAVAALRRRRRLITLSVVLHGVAPVVAAPRSVALPMAQLLAGDSAPGVVPAEAGAFRVLVEAPGLRPASRARLQTRRGEAALALGEPGYAIALEAFIEAAHRGGVLGAPERWPEPFQTYAHRAFAERLGAELSAEGESWTYLDLLCRTNDDARLVPLETLVAAFRSADGGAGGLLGGRGELEWERVVFTGSYLMLLGLNPFASGNMVAHLFRDLTSEQLLVEADAALELGRNGIRVMFLCLLAVEMSDQDVWERIRDETRRIIEACARLGDGRRWYHNAAAAALRHLGLHSLGLEHAERAIALEARRDRVWRVPRSYEAYGDLALDVAASGGAELDLGALVEALEEAVRVQQAVDELARRIHDAGEIPAIELHRHRGISTTLEKLVDVLLARPAPRCCTDAPRTVPELIELGLEIDASNRTDFDRDIAEHSQRPAH